LSNCQVQVNNKLTDKQSNTVYFKLQTSTQAQQNAQKIAFAQGSILKMFWGFSQTRPFDFTHTSYSGTPHV